MNKILPSYDSFNALLPDEYAMTWYTLDRLDKVVLAIEALTDIGAPFDRDEIAAWIADVDTKVAQAIPPSHDATNDTGTAPKE